MEVCLLMELLPVLYRSCTCNFLLDKKFFYAFHIIKHITICGDYADFISRSTYNYILTCSYTFWLWTGGDVQCTTYLYSYISLSNAYDG